MGKAGTLSTKQIAMIGVATAVICILAPLSLPIGPVPISLTNMILFFSIYCLGTNQAVFSCLLYLLIGLVGLPVFSGYSAGVGKLLGPTGGYLIGFVPMTLIAGTVIWKFQQKVIPSILGMIAGTICLYILGTAWLSYQAGMGFGAALMAGVIPFIPGDLIKMILAAVVGPQLWKRLKKADVF